VQHCYHGITRKRSENHTGLQGTLCSSQVKVQHNKTVGQLTDNVTEYVLFCSFAVLDLRVGH